jgi:hypothetical protein
MGLCDAQQKYSSASRNGLDASHAIQILWEGVANFFPRDLILLGRNDRVLSTRFNFAGREFLAGGNFSFMMEIWCHASWL